MDVAKLNATVDSIVKMLQAVRTMVDANPEKFAEFPAFDIAFNKMKDKLAEIESLTPISVKKTKGIKEVKDLRLVELCNATLAVSRPVSAYASSINDAELKLLMDVKMYKLERLVPNALTATCQNIYDKALELERDAAPFGLTEGKLLNLKDKKKVFSENSNKVGAVKSEINTSKKDMKRLTYEAIEILEGQMATYGQPIGRHRPHYFRTVSQCPQKD